MSGCCSPKGYRWVFSERNARAEAKRYRSKGLDATSRRIVDYLTSEGVAGMTVLEVGGGIGAIQVELLKAGAASAVSIELTPTYEDVARQLLDEAGLAERVERKVMDFAEASPAVEAADIVVLNRVVCCYPICRSSPPRPRLIRGGCSSSASRAGRGGPSPGSAPRTGCSR